jgi:hypothetical protein
MQRKLCMIYSIQALTIKGNLLTWRCCMRHGSSATLMLHATLLFSKSTTFDGSHPAISVYTH